ncbi:hypothetical protein [Neobacillus muris]|uniref:hypothetical protein n=1 Tax=Neobacillus muris TaxID=2941334 RepID=UPI00203D4A4C|nr:hypothetical protein [Neobacillus muris]
MAALAYEQYLDVKELSDEKLVELYVTGILEKYDHEYQFLEAELFERRLFLVALERYDDQKGFFQLSATGS